MTGTNPENRQAEQDIRRAVVLMSLAQGLSRTESAAALQYDAAVAGVSLHAAALVVLSPHPTTGSLAVEPPPSRRRRHMHAVTSGDEVRSAGPPGPAG